MTRINNKLRSFSDVGRSRSTTPPSAERASSVLNRVTLSPFSPRSVDPPSRARSLDLQRSSASVSNSTRMLSSLSPGRELSVEAAHGGEIDVLSSTEQTWQRDGVHTQRNRTNITKAQAALKAIHEEVKCAHRHRVMTMEIVTKTLTYSRIGYEEFIEIPIFIDGKSRLVNYKARVIDLGQGNLAYLFIPSDNQKAPPILTFRGTCPSSDPETIRSTLGARGLWGLVSGLYFDIGASDVSRNKEQLIAILKELNTREGPKPWIGGHSLGAAIAQRLMVEEPVYHLVDRLIAFNSPSMSRSITEKWNALEDQGIVRKDQAEIYNTEGDRIVNHHFYCPHLNHYFIGKKYLFVPDTTEQVRSHTSCVTGLKGRFYTLERSDIGRSMIKTALIGFLFFVKGILTLPLYLLAVPTVWAVTKIRSHRSDKQARSLARRAVHMRTRANVKKYRRDIRMLEAIALGRAKFSDEKGYTSQDIQKRAVHQLARIAQQVEGGVKLSKDDLARPLRSKEDIQIAARYCEELMIAHLEGNERLCSRELFERALLQLGRICDAQRGSALHDNRDVITVTEPTMTILEKVEIVHQVWWDNQRKEGRDLIINARQEIRGRVIPLSRLDPYHYNVQELKQVILGKKTLPRAFGTPQEQREKALKQLIRMANAHPSLPHQNEGAIDLNQRNLRVAIRPLIEQALQAKRYATESEEDLLPLSHIRVPYPLAIQE